MTKRTIWLIVFLIIALIGVGVLAYFYFTKDKNERGEGWILSPDKKFWVYVGEGLNEVEVRRDENNKSRFVYCLNIPNKMYTDVDGCKDGEKALFAIVFYSDEELREKEALSLFNETDEVFIREEGINYSFQRPQGVLLEYDYPDDDTFYYEVMESFELAE